MAIRDAVVRAPGAYDQDEVSRENVVLCLDEHLTVQSDKEDADINTIVRRFGIGQLPVVNERAPMFADFAEVFDYQSAQNAIIEANRAFMAMPAGVRERFGNDPQRFVEFCSETMQKDGKTVLRNLEEMRKMGLAEPSKERVDGEPDSDVGTPPGSPGGGT